MEINGIDYTRTNCLVAYSGNSSTINGGCDRTRTREIKITQVLQFQTNTTRIFTIFLYQYTTSSEVIGCSHNGTCSVVSWVVITIYVNVCSHIIVACGSFWQCIKREESC